MAIGFGELRTISRSRGESSTAATAYRAGLAVDDEHTGERHDYTARNKSGEVEALEIITPEHDISLTRSQLWNAVEKSEKRKNAMLAREWIGALPKEVSRESQRRIAEGFGKDIAKRFGVAVDVCIHRHDEGNPHCHVLFTTRKFSGGALKEKTRELNDIATSRGHVEEMRQTWERLCNDELKAVNANGISMKSYARRGLEKEPVAHPKKSKTSSRKAAIARRKAKAKTERTPERKTPTQPPAPSFLERFGESLGLYKSEATRHRETQEAAETTKGKQFAEARGRGLSLVMLAQAKDFDGVARQLDAYESERKPVIFSARQSTGRNILHCLFSVPQTEQTKVLAERIEKRIGPENFKKLMDAKDTFGKTPRNFQSEVKAATPKPIKMPSALPTVRPVSSLDSARKPSTANLRKPAPASAPRAGAEHGEGVGGESFGERLAGETNEAFAGRLAYWRQEQENKREYARKNRRRGPG